MLLFSFTLNKTCMLMILSFQLIFCIHLRITSQKLLICPYLIESLSKTQRSACRACTVFQTRLLVNCCVVRCTGPLFWTPYNQQWRQRPTYTLRDEVSVEFNVPFEHKYGYIRDEGISGGRGADEVVCGESVSLGCVWVKCPIPRVSLEFCL